MNSILAHRGLDGAAVWHNGVVGLGHRMLHTTPESLHEVLPLINRAADFAITADARIDNREEMIASLDLKHRPARELADSELILAAYEKWGEHCPQKLLGDFVFVIWDGRQQTLFCGRDHFGVKPFYYFHQPGHLFAFASEIKALLCLPEVPRQLNEVMVGCYLVDQFEDKASTFYQNIQRLPPAHSMSINARGARLNTYWSLDPSSELLLNSDEEYAEAFHENFTEAVRCRIRSAFPRGSHLSGGLDSSAVTCTARTLLDGSGEGEWHVFSNIFDDVPECDERPYINTVLAQGGYVPHYIHADRSSPLADLERVFRYQDEPCIGPNHFLPWGLNQAAGQAGVRVVLDGFDGDTTVSHGIARFTELAFAGHWETFAQEAQALAPHFNVSPDRLLQGYGLAAIEDLAQRQRWLAFASSINQINRFFQASRRELLWRHGVRPLTKSWMTRKRSSLQGSIDPIINSDFVRRVDLEERIRFLNGDRLKPPRTVRADQWRTLTSGLFPTVLELSDRCAAAFAVDVRHPFMDKRLIEFCLALPSSQKLYQGWSRIVMRRAMAGILPEEIRWRGGKTDMNPNFLHGFFTADRKILDEIVWHPNKSIGRYIDTDALSQVYERLVSQRKAKITDAMTMWKAATLSCWLHRAGFAASSNIL